MTITVGSRSGARGPERPGLTDEEIRDMITTQVTMAVRKDILEVFGSIKTMIIEKFYKRYATVTEAVAVVATTNVVTTGIQRRGSFQYRDFSNINPRSSTGSRIRLCL